MNIKKVILTLTFLLTLCSCSNTKESNLYGVDTYIYNEYNFPQVFGKPNINDKDLVDYINLDKETLYSEVNSYIDLLRINSLKKYSERFDTFDVYCWAKEHYENVGLISTKIINENNKYIFGNLLYIEIDNQYYILDISKDTNDKEWLKYYKSNNAVIDSINKLKNVMQNDYPIRYHEFEIIEPNKVIVLPNNTLSYTSNNLNTESYTYLFYILPIGLGMPKLSSEEIKSLSKSTDYKKVQESINNIGDAVAYIDALNITSELDNSKGNPYYINNNAINYYVNSGIETIKEKRAACTGVSTLMNFLLYDDYEEFGYITGRQHCVNYAKGFDNKYYLIDGTDVIGTHRWLIHYHFTNGSDTLEDLINNYLQENFLPYTEQQNYMFSWNYDGIWTYTETMDENGYKIYGFPNGSKNVTIWLINQPTKTAYFEPLYPADHFNANFYDKK